LRRQPGGAPPAAADSAEAPRAPGDAAAARSGRAVGRLHEHARRRRGERGRARGVSRRQPLLQRLLGMRAAARRLSGQLRRSPRALAVLRWALGAAILGAVLASLSWEETARAFAGVVWPFVLANLAIKIALRVLAGIKWHLIVRLGDPGAPLRQSLAAHFAGTAVGAVAPVLGSDLTVAYAYYRQSQRASAAISTIFADRLIGMYLLIAIGAVAVLANLERMLELEPLLAFAA